MSVPRGDFDRELYCGCGASVDRYVDWGAPGGSLYDYADPDTGERTNSCPQCKASIIMVVAADARIRRAER